MKDLNEILKNSNDKKGGFFPLDDIKKCNDKEHNAPTGICIPQGQGYRHVCPSCGTVQTIIPPQVTLSGEKGMTDWL